MSKYILLGYGIKYENETLEGAARCYLNSCQIHNTVKEAKDFIKEARKEGSMTKKEKAKLFKIAVKFEGE